MGFISSAQTNGMVIYFTPIGMKYLNGKKQSPTDLSITYFTLGDSDTNYNIINKLSTGYVADITGEASSCLKSIAVDFNNADVYHNWLSSPTGVTPSFHKSSVNL